MDSNGNLVIELIASIDAVLKAYDEGHAMFTKVDALRRSRNQIYGILEAAAEKQEQKETA